MHDGEGIFDPSWSYLNVTYLWLLEELVEEEEEVEVEDEVEIALVDLFFLPESALVHEEKLRRADHYCRAKLRNHVCWMVTEWVMEFAMNLAEAVLAD